MLICCFSWCRSCLVLCARSRASLPAGFSTCTAGRRARAPARPAVDRARARPADVGRCARVVRCDGMPGRARARMGSCDASRARVVRSRARPAPAGPYGLVRRLWPYHGRGKSMGMLAPAMRPRPHSVACRPRARPPAGPRGPSSHACTTSTRYPWKSAKYSSWSASSSAVMSSSSAAPLSSIP